jgi:cysteinyl-tRNA synthetase
MDFSEETLAQAGARGDRFREVFRNPSEPAPDDAWERFAAALDDDFNTPEALAVMHEWRPGEIVGLAERRRDARSCGAFDEADRLRAEIEAAGWEVRDVADGFRLVRK